MSAESDYDLKRLQRMELDLLQAQARIRELEQQLALAGRS